MFIKKLLLSILFIFLLSSVKAFAGYSLDRSSTTSGNSSYTGSSILKLEAEISYSSYMGFYVTKKDGGKFSSSGTMYLRKNFFFGNAVMERSVVGNFTSRIYFGMPVAEGKYYAYYKSNDGGWAWVGSITISNDLDEQKPTGSIQGLQSDYKQGDRFYYNVRGYDAKKLVKLTFTITDKSGNKKHEKIWNENATNTPISRENSFYLNGWSAGIYYYALWLKDAADNVNSYTGSFLLNDPKVNSVTPTNVVLNQRTTFTVKGSNLPSSLAFFIPECEGLASLGGHTTSHQFICTPSYTAGNKSSVVKDKSGGKILYNFNVSVVDKSPKVTSVTPTNVTLNEQTTFTVKGTNLQSSLAFFIPECESLIALGGNSTSRLFRCTPSYTAGSKSSVVKDKSGGKTLYSFNVSVVDTSAKVTSVAPTNVILNQKTTFTVKGANFLSSLAFFIPECEDLTSLGGNATSRQFSCTPSHTAGSKSSVVKDKSGGKTLYSFNVSVVDTSAKVTSVAPTNVVLNQKTTFIVKGANLPSSLAFFIPECEDLTSLGGNTTSRQFSCTPSHTAGSKPSVVKDKSGGKVLYSFNVDVVDKSAKVASVTPTNVILNQQTTFTVTGANLPSSLAFFIPECEGLTAVGSGNSTSHQFRCTPSYTVGAKTSVVKDKPKGTELYNFVVTIKYEDKYANVSNWAQGAAAFMVNENIIDDPSNHDLRGISPTNRAELATMLYRVLGGGKPNADAQFKAWAGTDLTSTFLDMNDASVWYYDAVTYLSHLQFTDSVAVFDRGSGKTMNPLFRPANAISRGWALKAILESWNIAPLTSFSGIAQFDDVAFDHPAAGYIYRAVQEGLVRGDDKSNTYRPNTSVNREDLFVILHRLMDASTNIKEKSLQKPSIDKNAFSDQDFNYATIGIRYEQPICYGVTAPTIAIKKLEENTQTIDEAELYTVDLQVTISGGSDACIDSKQVTHQKNLFAAWHTNSGTFIDVTPQGETPFSKVRWIAPDRYASQATKDDYEITVYVGDNLGTEVSDRLVLQMTQKTASNNKPTVSLDALPERLTGGRTIKLSGTAKDTGVSHRANIGIREVFVEYSRDNNTWEVIARNLTTDANNRWQVEWFVPNMNDTVSIRTHARNIEGNVNDNIVSRSTTITPEMRISGHVISDKGESLVNANIMLKGASATTRALSDNNGSFSFVDLAATTYQLQATNGNDQSQWIDVILTNDNPLQQIELIVIKDTDNDGVGDQNDNCPTISNPDQEDKDKDRLGDVCDYQDDTDTDKDGLRDEKDNCPSIANVDQANQDNDRFGDICDSDRDGDQVNNDKDAFPDNRSEQLDTDGDGIGNNADKDDDNDGLPDDWEKQYGLNPLDATDAAADLDNDGFSNLEEFTSKTKPNDASSSPNTCTLDIDDNGKADALTDGILLLRYSFDFHNDALVSNAIALTAKRTTAKEIERYLSQCNAIFDVDNNSKTEALKDGLLILRYLFDFRSNDLVDGAISTDAKRTETLDIELYLENLRP